MENVLRTIGTISRALDSIANVEFNKLDLARGQYLYLVRIYEQPGIIQGHLAELLAVDRTTANRVITKLTAAQLIQKEPDPHNKKIQHLRATPRGAELAIFILRENQYSTQVALAGFAPEEITQLAAYLKRMQDNVESDWHQVKQGHHRIY